jgi:predicted dinucleotide-binding enzyme
MRVVILGAERLGRVLALDLLQAGHEVRRSSSGASCWQRCPPDMRDE